MSIVQRFTLPHGSNIVINLPKRRSKQNRTTVLLGVNGTRKSTLLRGLLDDGMVSIGAEKMTKYAGIDTVFSVQPNLILAISAVPNDRFPSNSKFGGPPLQTRYSTPKYGYIGPRQNQNLVSRNQSVQALVSAVLEVGPTTADKRSFMRRLSEKTGVPSTFEMRLRLQRPTSPRHRNEQASDYFTRIKDDRSLFRRLPQSIQDSLFNTLTPSMLRELDRLQRFCADGPSVPFHVDLAGSVDFLDFDPQIIYFALRSRFLYLDDLSFGVFSPGEKREISPDDFSAGQWGLFSSLATLALSVQPNTLILVDEPESALHPSWQREYLDDLHEAVGHRSGCHIFLATHSPLIVGAMRSKNADLVILRKDNEKGVITAELSDIPTGWQTNDVLEDIFDLPSTRSPFVVQRLDEALALVAEGLNSNRRRIHSIATELLPLTSSLPENDLACSIIISLLKISEPD